ncbi:hypothetical protein V6767_06280 [Martelella sp. FLE1502]
MPWNDGDLSVITEPRAENFAAAVDQEHDFRLWIVPRVPLSSRISAPYISKRTFRQDVDSARRLSDGPRPFNTKIKDDPSFDLCSVSRLFSRQSEHPETAEAGWRRGKTGRMKLPIFRRSAFRREIEGVSEGVDFLDREVGNGQIAGLAPG